MFSIHSFCQLCNDSLHLTAKNEKLSNNWDFILFLEFFNPKHYLFICNLRLFYNNNSCIKKCVLISLQFCSKSYILTLVSASSSSVVFSLALLSSTELWDVLNSACSLVTICDFSRHFLKQRSSSVFKPWTASSADKTPESRDLQEHKTDILITSHNYWVTEENTPSSTQILHTTKCITINILHTLVHTFWQYIVIYCYWSVCKSRLKHSITNIYFNSREFWNRFLIPRSNLTSLGWKICVKAS